MKVLQVLPELDSGGVERGTLELASHLVAQGHESLVVSAGGRMVPDLEAAGSRHLSLAVHRKSPASLLQVRPLRALLREERPDILHLRSRLPAWLAWLAWRQLDPATRPHLVTTVHGFNSVSRYSRIMTCGEKVICVSNAIRQFVLESYPETDPDKLQVIHRGIDPRDYPRGYQPDPSWLDRWHAEFPETAGQRLLVLPGRLTRIKGHRKFIDLIDRLRSGEEGAVNRDVHGLIVGGTHPRKQDYANEIKAQVAERGLAAHVTFTGQRSDLREIFAIASLVYSLTTKPESFGRTVLEALSLGTPVIGYDDGGVGEILGRLFPEGAIPRADRDALLARSRALLAAPRAPEIPGDHPFQLETMLDEILALYESLAL